MGFIEKRNTFEGQWKSIVTKWGKLNNKYFKKTCEFPASYMENSNSALFSVAAWQCGNMCLCEVDVSRKRLAGGRLNNRGGRFDLYLNVEDRFFVLEAKHRHLLLGSHYSLRHCRLMQLIGSIAEEASTCEDAAREWGDKIGGLFFFSATIPEKAPYRTKRTGLRKQRKACRNLIEGEVNSLYNNLNCCKLVSGFELIGHALFENNIDSVVEDEWSGEPWPALFGVIGIAQID